MKDNRIKLYLPVPPSANMLFPTNKQGRRFPSKRYKAWKKEAKAVLDSQNVRPAEPLKGRIDILLNFRFADKRKRDIANFEKAVTDFLGAEGFYEDDSQIDCMTLMRGEIGAGEVIIMLSEI